MSNNRQITYVQAINEAISQSMAIDKNVFIYGLGCTDSSRVFGTTIGLEEKFGNSRVFDVPCCEAALTGNAIGASMMGLRPILTHQRVDFSLLSLDQLINNAAKMKFMFGLDDDFQLSMVIKMSIGRQFGNGSQHSGTYFNLFCKNNLTLVAPSSPKKAKGLLVSSIFNNNPVIFVEHRWTHQLKENVPQEIYHLPLGKCSLSRKGKDITVVAVSYSVIVSLAAADFLINYNISVEVVDIQTIYPLDTKTIFKSIEKTKHLIAFDLDHGFCGVSSEVISSVAIAGIQLDEAPDKLTLPEHPCPASPKLSKEYYPTEIDLIKLILKNLNIKNKKIIKDAEIKFKREHYDVPDNSFTGPF